MKIKFNIGCGEKLFECTDDVIWVNIDIVEPTVDQEGNKLKFTPISVVNEEALSRHKKGDILFHQSLVKELTWVSSDLADEVHAYHLVEHLFYTEVLDTLKEWGRILKPEGILCTEQPDFNKCISNYLLGIFRQEESLVYQQGMLGIFGDSYHETPYMAHKWGWTPESLGQKFYKAGFEQVSHLPAVTHMKDTRDFRIEGRKPKND